MTLALIHHHDDNQDVDDDVIWYDMIIMTMTSIMMIFIIGTHGARDLIWTSEYQKWWWYGDHHHDNHDHLNNYSLNNIQVACQSTNLSSLVSWSTVTHSHKSHWHSNYQVEIYENNGTPENEYVKVQKSSFSKGLWWHWDEPKIANDHHDCKQFVHWA